MGSDELQALWWQQQQQTHVLSTSCAWMLYAAAQFAIHSCHSNVERQSGCLNIGLPALQQAMYSTSGARYAGCVVVRVCGNTCIVASNMAAWQEHQPNAHMDCTYLQPQQQ